MRLLQRNKNSAGKKENKYKKIQRVKEVRMSEVG